MTKQSDPGADLGTVGSFGMNAAYTTSFVTLNCRDASGGKELVSTLSGEWDESAGCARGTWSFSS